MESLFEKSTRRIKCNNDCSIFKYFDGLKKQLHAQDFFQIEYDTSSVIKYKVGKFKITLANMDLGISNRALDIKSIVQSKLTIKYENNIYEINNYPSKEISSDTFDGFIALCGIVELLKSSDMESEEYINLINQRNQLEKIIANNKCEEKTAQEIMGQIPFDVCKSYCEDFFNNDILRAQIKANKENKKSNKISFVKQTELVTDK